MLPPPESLQQLEQLGHSTESGGLLLTLTSSGAGAFQEGAMADILGH